MRFLFYSLLMIMLPAVNLAMQSPKQAKKEVTLTILTRRLSLEDQSAVGNIPCLNRQVSPPIAIPRAKSPERTITHSYSTNSSENSLSKSPDSCNATPGTSPESNGRAGCLARAQADHYQPNYSNSDSFSDHRYYQDFPGQGYRSR